VALDDAKLADIRFDVTDINRCFAAARSSSELVTIFQARPIINAQAPLIKHWIDIGLLTAVMKNGKRYVVRTELENFHVKYVDKYKAAKILGISVAALKNWVKAGRIVPVTDYQRNKLFSKDDLVLWRDTHIDFGEALKCLGISPSKLCYWVKRGLVTIADDTPGLQRQYSRADILKLKNELP
jgi:DNA-binding transcriptional MerR regulator